MFVTDAHARYTFCEIKYTTYTANTLVVGDWGGGSGVARCWDRAGYEYRTEFYAAAVGASASFGACRTRGTITAEGPGFALNELLAGLGQVDLAPTFGRGQGGSIGLRLNVLGLNANVFASNMRKDGPCIYTVGVNGLISTNIGQPIRMGRTRRPQAPAVAGPVVRERGRPSAGQPGQGPAVAPYREDGVVVERVMR